MISALSNWIVQGYLSPRQSIRPLLGQGHNGLDVALLLLALGYLISAILELVFVGSGSDDGSRFTFHLIRAIMQIVGFLMLSGLIFWIGRAAGGAATLGDAQMVVAWHSVVTSILSPVMLGAMGSIAIDPEDPSQMPEISGLATIILMGCGGYMAWLLANYVAEAHRFTSAWRVLAVMLAVPMGAAFLMSLLASG